MPASLRTSFFVGLLSISAFAPFAFAAPPSDPIEFRLVTREELGGEPDFIHHFNRYGARGWELRALGSHTVLFQRTSFDARWEYKCIEISKSPLRDEKHAAESRDFTQLLESLHQQGWQVTHSMDNGLGLVLTRKRNVVETKMPQTDSEILEGVWQGLIAKKGPDFVPGFDRGFMRIENGVVTNASLKEQQPRRFKLVLKADQTPRQFDLVSLNMLTRQVVACGIYELDGDRLRVAFHQTNPLERPASFESIEKAADIIEFEKAY